MKSESKNGKNPVQPKKSEKLTRGEVQRLKEFRKGSPSEVQAGLTIGLDRAVLNRAILVGSASPSTVSKIRNFFTPETIEA